MYTQMSRGDIPSVPAVRTTTVLCPVCRSRMAICAPAVVTIVNSSARPPGSTGRKPVALFAMADVRSRQHGRISVVRRDAQQAAGLSPDDERIVVKPTRAALRCREPGQHDRRPAGNRHLAQLHDVLEVTHPLTIAKQKRRCRTCRAGQCRRLEPIEPTNNQLAATDVDDE